MTDETTDTDRIERDLARTRARMDSRLGELQDKMSPSQLVNDAFAYMQGGDGADFTANLVSRAKANPLPVALVGVGLIWLMASSHSRPSSSATAPQVDIHRQLYEAEHGVERFEHEDEQTHAGRLDEARGRVLGIGRDASDTAASYAERIKDAIGTASSAVRETVHDIQTQARGAMSSLGDQTSKGASAMQQTASSMSSSTRQTLSGVTSNPLALGAIAAVVGLVAGALIPTLDEEKAALGSLAGKLKSAGADAAQDLVDRGGRMAGDTLAVAKDSADAHGLNSAKSVGDVVQGLKSGDLIGDAKQVAQETLQAGRDSAQTHLRSDGDTSGA